MQSFESRTGQGFQCIRTFTKPTEKVRPTLKGALVAGFRLMALKHASTKGFRRLSNQFCEIIIIHNQLITSITDEKE